jgi:uncharacterized repeat protein (TIGR03803 family)
MPKGNLVLDSDGNLYGATVAGGVYTSSPCAANSGCGTVFELSPAGGGPWTEKVLHTFTGNPDGFDPQAGVTTDSAGNLYGTTTYGGVSTACNSGVGCGTVFELVKGTGGAWTEHVIHSFDLTDGYYPYSPLSFHADNYFGTTSSTVFELTRAPAGPWSLTTLYSFTDPPESTYSGVVIDATGDLFGTIYNGSGEVGDSSLGNIYQLTPPGGSGTWTESILYNFAGGSDGENPVGGLLLYRNALVGTTSDCLQTLFVGCGGYGHVFALTDF